MPTPRILKVGSTVIYTDTKGHEKPAIILATKESVVEGTQLPALNDDQFHIQVLGFVGNYNRFSVPLDKSVKDNDGFKNEDGKLVGVLR